MSPSEILKHSLPRPWLGLLIGLESNTDQLAHMEQWLKVTNARQCEGLCWTALLSSLTQCKPLIHGSSKKLEFIPVLFHLPGLWQCHLLTFIYLHSAAITQRSLCQFVDILYKYLDCFKTDSTKANHHPSSECHVSVETNIFSSSSDDGNHVSPAVCDISKQSNTTEQHSAQSSNLSWTEFWLNKLKTKQNFHEAEKTKFENKLNRCHTFSADHCKWKQRILDHLNDSNNEGYGCLKPWSFGFGNTEPDTRDVPSRSQLSIATLESQEQPIMSGDTSNLDLESLEMSPAKKIKLDKTLNEDAIVLLSQKLPGLQEELLTELQSLKESWHSGSSQAEQDRNLSVITQCSHSMIEEICKVLELSNLPESSLAIVAMEISRFKEKLPLSHAAVLAKHCLLEKMLMLPGTASRHLLEACTCLTEAYPTEVIQSVLTPVLLHPDIGSHHCDLIIRLLKDTLQPHHRQQLLRNYVEKQPRLCDPVIRVLQHVLDTKTEFDERTINHLVKIVSNSSCDFVDSLKFGKLLLALIKQYNKQLNNSQVMELEQAASSHGTFLKKSILTTLKKIRKT